MMEELLPLLVSLAPLMFMIFLVVVTGKSPLGALEEFIAVVCDMMLIMARGPETPRQTQPMRADRAAAPPPAPMVVRDSRAHRARVETAQALVSIAQHMVDNTGIPPDVIDNGETHLRRARLMLQEQTRTKGTSV